MGNIFKTLGIDDFFRDTVPVIGGGIANFLTGLGGGKNENIAQLSGPSPGRISNEDYQHNQNLLDSSNPREIKRQGAFLEGVAPSQGKAMEIQAPYQAAAHNTYEDATYGEDTQRQVGRIQDMSSGLKMSPWEITGSGASSGQLSAPPARPQDGGNPQGAAFLHALTPLKIAEMNNRTALMQTMLQTNTQKSIADQATGQGGIAQSQIATQKQQMAESAARTLNIEANTAKTFQDIEAQAQNMIVQVVTTVLQNMPRETLSLGGYNRSQIAGAGNVLRQLSNRGQGTFDADKVRNWLKDFSQNEMKQLADDLRWWGKYSQGADMIGKVGGIADSLSSTFLKSITGASKYTHELKDF